MATKKASSKKKEEKPKKTVKKTTNIKKVTPKKKEEKKTKTSKNSIFCFFPGPEAGGRDAHFNMMVAFDRYYQVSAERK